MKIFNEFARKMGWKANEAQERMEWGRGATNRMNSDGATIAERLAMSAAISGLEPWSPENSHEAESIRPLLEHIRKVRDESI